MKKKKEFIPWIVCDQDKNECPSIEELSKEIAEYYDGDAGQYEFEISLVKEDNKHGQKSFGWDGDDKIVLFEYSFFEFETVKELHKKLSSFYSRANKKCKLMNENKENALY